MSERAAAASLLSAGLLLRLVLLLAFPALYGGDAAARLARSDELLLGYQLPLPQLIVFATRGLCPNPLWTRLVFSGIGALVPVFLLRALRPSAGAASALAAAALAALHPILTYYSMVPYQEPLLMLLLLAAAGELQRGRDRRAGLLIGLACLCRFEAWIAAALAALGRSGRVGRLRALFLYGWAPLAWMLAWRGLSPAGTYVLDLDPEAARLSRLVFLASKLREYSGWFLIALACLGIVAVARRGAGRRALAWGGFFVALLVASVVAAGHEFPPGSGRVSERLAQVPAVALCALAGIAFGAAFEATPQRWKTAAMALGAAALLVQGAVWVRFTRNLVREATAEPANDLAYRVARLANGLLAPGERIAVIGPPVDSAAIEDYVRKVERSGGNAEAARSVGRALARHSPDADRVAANLARPPRTVVEEASGAALVAVFDDGAVPPPGTAGALVQRFAAGTRGVSVYRTATR